MYNNITKIMCFDRFTDVFLLILCVKTLIFQKKINNNVFNFIVNDEKCVNLFQLLITVLIVMIGGGMGCV